MPVAQTRDSQSDKHDHLASGGEVVSLASSLGDSPNTWLSGGPLPIRGCRGHLKGVGESWEVGTE